MNDFVLLSLIVKSSSSEFVSSSIPSWQISTAHAQPFRGARDLAFCLKVALDSLLVWASSEGSGETARMRRLVWTFAACIGDKYQIRLSRPKSELKFGFSFFQKSQILSILKNIEKHLSMQMWNGLISHVRKVLLKVILNRLQPKAKEIIAEKQACFRAWRGTTEQMFSHRILCKK